MSDQHVRAGVPQSPKLPGEPVKERTFIKKLVFHLIDRARSGFQRGVAAVSSASQAWTRYRFSVDTGR
eukprot:3492641-Heterocapsa_arctica.AAC.1